MVIDVKQANLNANVVRDFGAEWSRFDQSSLSVADQMEIFNGYFHIFPWDSLPSGSVGADVGCGSGRWAVLVAPQVEHLHMVDPSSEALHVARKNLSNVKNISFHQSSVERLPFECGSLDFVYSLGVLHHVPDTTDAIRSIARVLKPGAPFLVYLYYKFENRPLWFRLIWHTSDIFRKFVSRMPVFMKNFVCEGIALSIYLPLARVALMLERFGMLPNSWPLAYYRNREYYVMRTDALDRFGTRLEKRFTRKEIETMLQSAGFTDIRFSETQPFWCAVGIKKG
jgi:SAM-dependent methyltransferase